MAIPKPDLTRVWASAAPGGNIIDPDVGSPGKFDAGWIAEIPPFQYFNFLQQLFSQGLAVLNEQGIFSWDATTTYPVGAYVKGSDFGLYTAIVEQAGNDPVTDGGTNWTPFTGGGGGGLPVLTNDQPLQGTEFDAVTVVDILKITAADRLQIGFDTNPIDFQPSDGLLTIIGSEATSANVSGLDVRNSNQLTNVGGFFGQRTGSDAVRIENYSTLAGMEFYSGGAGGVGSSANKRMEFTPTRGRIWDGDDFFSIRPALETAYWNDTGLTCSLRILDGAGSLREVGFNQMNVVNSTSTALNIFDKVGINRYINSTAATAATYTMTNPGNTNSFGQMIMVRNGGSNPLIIATGTQTVNWFDGATVTTGDRTLAVGGIVTIVRRALSEFDIMGSGLS